MPERTREATGIALPDRRVGLDAAEEAMARLRRALGAGWDAVELRKQYNLTVGEKRAAESALTAVPSEEPSVVRHLVTIINDLYTEQIVDVRVDRWPTAWRSFVSEDEHAP